jgi:hypothetical protein
MQDRLEHNTTQFSHGCRVLRLDGPNHINPRVPRVHLELTTKRLKAFPAKEPHQAVLELLRWKCHRERESERETTSQSRAGRSRRSRGRTDTTIVVLESQPQPTAGTTASPPTTVGPNAALLAACQPLNNPPPVGASPSAAKQWRHDVSQLVIIAINTPHRDG